MAQATGRISLEERRSTVGKIVEQLKRLTGKTERELQGLAQQLEDKAHSDANGQKDTYFNKIVRRLEQARHYLQTSRGGASGNAQQQAAAPQQGLHGIALQQSQQQQQQIGSQPMQQMTSQQMAMQTIQQQQHHHQPGMQLQQQQQQKRLPQGPGPSGGRSQSQSRLQPLAPPLPLPLNLAASFGPTSKRAPARALKLLQCYPTPPLLQLLSSRLLPPLSPW
mmetsp:Transcript_39192/g.110976  ORF Transcript_39192/g.110976 Transcript_39192/m.110976 type:complete len:222 (-) Transcript_39192:1680-2345(-)